VPPPRAWAAILTAPEVDPTNAPRNRAAAFVGVRTGSYYFRS
jgi:hypothetical protein